jgi:signal transduction histidine kinase
MNQQILNRTAGFFVFTVFTLAFAGRCNAETPQNRLPADSLKSWDSLISRNLVINNKLAKSIAFMTLEMSVKVSDKEALSRAYYNLGRVFQKNDPEKAYGFFLTASKLARTQTNNTIYPKSLYYLALINDNAFNSKDALMLLDTCIQVALRIGDWSILPLGLCLKGTIALESKDSVRAGKLFDSAFYLADKHHLNFQKGLALANKALLAKNPDEIIEFNRRALGLIANIPGSEEEYASILANLGFSFSNPDSSFKYLEAAIGYAEKYSFARIQISAYNNLAYIYLDKKQLPLAISCLADKAIPLAIKENDHDWLSTLYDSYSDILFQSGDFKKAAELQKKAYREKYATDLQYSTKQIRLLASILELKQKDLEINNTRKTVIIQHAKLSHLKLVLAAISLLLLFSIASIILIIQQSRLKLQRKTIESARKLIGMEETEKNRIGMELHDSLGSFFQGISQSIDNITEYSFEVRDGLKNQLNEFWMKTREISHRMSNTILGQKTLQQLVTELSGSYTEKGKIEIIIRFTGDQVRLPDETKLHIYRIIQELFTNAQKYADKGQVHLTISQNEGGLSIFYLDQGPGFNVDQIKGMGISNIFERVLLLNGTAKLKTTPGSKTSWDIQISDKKYKNTNYD